MAQIEAQEKTEKMHIQKYRKRFGHIEEKFTNIFFKILKEPEVVVLFNAE